MNQLHQFVLIDDLARGGGDILTQAKSLHVSHSNREPSVAALQIVKKVLQAAQQVLPPGLKSCGQNLWIGRDEVGWGQGIDKLARVEIDLVRCRLVHVLD